MPRRFASLCPPARPGAHAAAALVRAVLAGALIGLVGCPNTDPPVPVAEPPSGLPPGVAPPPDPGSAGPDAPSGSPDPGVGPPDPGSAPPNGPDSTGPRAPPDGDPMPELDKDQNGVVNEAEYASAGFGTVFATIDIDHDNLLQATEVAQWAEGPRRKPGSPTPPTDGGSAHPGASGVDISMGGPTPGPTPGSPGLPSGTPGTAPGTSPSGGPGTPGTPSTSPAPPGAPGGAPEVSVSAPPASASPADGGGEMGTALDAPIVPPIPTNLPDDPALVYVHIVDLQRLAGGAPLTLTLDDAAPVTVEDAGKDADLNAGDGVYGVEMPRPAGTTAHFKVVAGTHGWAGDISIARATSTRPVPVELVGDGTLNLALPPEAEPEVMPADAPAGATGSGGEVIVQLGPVGVAGGSTSWAAMGLGLGLGVGLGRRIWGGSLRS